MCFSYSTTCLGVVYLGNIPTRVKSMSLQSLGVNSQDFSKTLYVFYDNKKIEMKFYFIEVMVMSSNTYVLMRILQICDKPLFVTKLKHFRDKLGMAENVSLAEREC